MSEVKKRIEVNTPKGIAKYPWLDKPSTKFNPTGVYQVGLLLQKDSIDAKNLMNQIDAWITNAYNNAIKDLSEAADAALKAGKGAESAKKKAEINQVVKAEAPYNIDLDAITGEETGFIEFKFKLDAQYISKKDGKVVHRRPRLFDAAGNPLIGVSVFGGSVIKINFTPSEYYISATKKAGIKLVLNAVQVLELVSGGVKETAEGYGFEKEEGFIFEQPEASNEEDLKETGTDLF